MKDLLQSIFIFTILSSLPEKVFNSLVVTPMGPISGKIIYFEGIPIRTFLGIPYAQKPMGGLRFKKPLPAKPWNAILNATKFPPQCVQFSTNPFPFYYNSTALDSEDCLYLNIWVPGIVNGDLKKSVMFWIHGGGFRISSTLIDFYHGQALAAEGDVIVVTTNYRLGVEGFLFSNTEDAPGNMGLWDIVEALKWVKNNIQNFGGDPDSITLFGQSAGGIAIGMFCTTPVARGLFERVIMQSGSPASSAGDNNGKDFEISQKVAKFVGCAYSDDDLKQYPQAVVQCLKHKDPLELAKALSNVTTGDPRGFYPRYGDDLLPKDPRQAIIDGDFKTVDVLIGSNNGDGATLITKSMQDVFGFFGEKYPIINKSFGSSIIRDKFKNFPEPDKVVEQYLDGVEDDNYGKIRFKVFTASGDYTRTCPSNYFAESFAEMGARVYSYFFVHRPSFTPWAAWMLAVHHDETPFVFGYPLRYPNCYNTIDQDLSRSMIHAWTSFAKTGVPEYGFWPQYSKQNPTFMLIDNEIRTGVRNQRGPHLENCDFFRPYLGFEELSNSKSP